MAQKQKGLVINKTAAIILILLLAFGGYMAYYFGYRVTTPTGATVVNQWTSNNFTYTLWSNGTTTSVPVSGTQPIPGAEPDPLYFTTGDPIAGGVIVSATIVVYDSTNKKVESLTSDATTGAIATTNSYYPGTDLVAAISKANYVTRYVPFKVPSTLTHTLYNQPVYNIKLETFLLGSYTVKAVDSSGVSYATTNFYNFTANATTSVSMTFTVYEATDNKGWWSSYDSLDKVQQNMILVGLTTDSYLVVQGGTPYSRGTSSYHISALPDGYPVVGTNPAGLTRVKVGNDYPAQGVCSVSYTFGKGSLAAGSSQWMNFTMYDYADQAYFAANGIGGPNAASVATFNLLFRA